MRPTQITDTQIHDFIVAGLREDIGAGDHTSLATISTDSRSRAVLKIKDYGVLAGVELAERIFRHLDPTAKLTVHKPDGSDVLYGETGFEVEGNTRALLQAERLALNTMQRMSGIATLSSRFAFEVGDLPVKVLDTRKTTPLIRFLEKWAVNIGGCENYRWGLFDWILIKDNHVDAAGGIRKAVERAQVYQKEKGLNLGITVEVRNLVELEELLDVGGFTRVMLYGPRFTRFDLSAVKRTRITERFDVEFRAEMLNAFNNINFIVGNPANDTVNIGGFGTNTFGQVTEAYRDTSTTNDPGGRLIQLVLRINF